MTVRVLIASDDPLARSGLTALLAERDEVTVVEGEPDVVVWEFRENAAPPRFNGPMVAVLADASHAPEARSAGATGLLQRSTDGDRLAAAVLAVASGLFVADSSLAPSLLRAEVGGDLLIEELTPRETEVLQLLGQGLTNKRIADRLDISEHTAKFHVNAILGKLGVRSRTEAIVQAARLGLVIL